MSNIVLVHIGSVFYDYINTCVTQCLKYKLNVHLVVSKELHDFIENTDNIVLSSVEDYITTEFKQFNIPSADKDFRDGFWMSTSLRFFIISEYAKRNTLTSFFHIENDNLIYTDLINEGHVLSNSEYNMSVVVDAGPRCVPSIVWFRNAEIANDLSNFMLIHTYANDVDSVFHFFNKRSDVINFPIIPNEANIEVKYLFDSINYSKYFESFNAIFDACAIGQYIGGVDPRNISGNTVGFINELCIFNPSHFKYIWENYEPFLIYEDKKIKINNLHIHSKRLSDFT